MLRQRATNALRTHSILQNESASGSRAAGDITSHKSSQTYERLRSSAKEFRLLTLQPGSNNDPIICSLSTASLVEGQYPAYETISYHWGGSSSSLDDEQPSGERKLDEPWIELLGKQILVPIAAEQALRCLRLPEKARTVWIDSVCINQADVVERKQQIAVMGDIYRQGTANLIHLGGEDKEAIASVRALNCASRRLQNELGKLSDDVQMQWRETRIKPNGWGKLENPPVLLDDPWLVKRMFKCAWFTRLWIVQETCLASTNTCYWAQERFDLQDLMDIVHVSRELEIAADDGFPHLYKTYCCLQQLRYPMLISKQFRSAKFDHDLEALMILVDVIRHCDVSYVHDRIFAFAGLLRLLPSGTEEAMKLLEADYHKALPAVFCDATRAMLLLSRSDFILTKASHRDKSELLDMSKPSWSFYWDRPQDLTQEAGRPTLAARSDAGLPTNGVATSLVINEHADPKVLSLQGFLLGEIAQFVPYVGGGTLHKDVATMRDLIERILSMAEAQIMARQSSDRHWMCEMRWSTIEKEAEQIQAAEALRRRELERAHEVVRRCLSRKVGDMQIVAYLNATSGSTDETPSGEPAKKEHTSKTDRTDMAAITVLSGTWNAAQFTDEPAAIRAFRDLRNHMRVNGELPGILSPAFDMHMNIATGSNNRCFFTTSFGDLGSGPKLTEPGDIVAVFFGARYPYVLRPRYPYALRPRPTCPFDGMYRFVGVAIIPNIMHGEVFERDLEEQTICLF